MTFFLFYFSVYNRLLKQHRGNGKPFSGYVGRHKSQIGVCADSSYTAVEALLLGDQLCPELMEAVGIKNQISIPAAAMKK